jgi:hypothetical protein
MVLLFIIDKPDSDSETKRRVIFLAVSVNIYERYMTVAGLGWALCLFSRKKLSLTEFRLFSSKTSKTLVSFLSYTCGAPRTLRVLPRARNYVSRRYQYRNSIGNVRGSWSKAQHSRWRAR